MPRITKKFVFEFDLPKTIHVSSNVKISVITTLKDFRDFFQIPWKVYQDNKYWVPPFWREMKEFFREDEPFWKHAKSRLFVAYKNNISVGRIAAIIDYKYLKTVGKNVGFFGFFECINDLEIALALLDAAEEWLTSKKMTLMHGPINGRVDIGAGFLIKGFDSTPYLLGNYSPKYYMNFAKEFGMNKSKDLVAYHVDLKKPIPQSVEKTAKRCEANGVKIRRFNRLRFKKEMDWWLDMFMQEFSDHWGYTSVPYEEVKSRFGIKQLRWIVDPDLFLVAEVDNQPIGFRWSLPDYNQVFKKLNGKLGVLGVAKVLWHRQDINRGRFIIMGIKKKYRGQGIGTCMNYHTLSEMKRRGYICAEYGWIDEGNIASRKAGEKIGGALHKIYRVYEKRI